MLQFIGHTIDAAQGAVEVLEVHHHHVIPQVQLLQVAHQVLVHDREFAREVGLDRQVAEAGLDGRIHADDVGNGCSRRDRHAVGVAHAELADALAQGIPFQGGRAVHVHVAAALLGQQVQAVDRQDAAVPQRARVAGVAATLLGQFGGSPVGVVAQGLGRLVGELHGGVAGIRDAKLVERILEAHHAQPHRAVPHVGVARLPDRVVIDVDHVVEHAHGRGHGLLELALVDLSVLEVAGQVDGAQVADGDLAVVGIQRDLGAQVGRVHHAHVLLRRAHVAGILESDPGVAGFEQHRQHLAPQVDGSHLLVQLEFAARRLRLVLHVGLFKVLAEAVVQVGAGGGREQGPLAVFHHALHEQVGDPVGRVHVVGAAAVVTGVLAQLQEFLDVQVPRFQVGADGALALAALVHRDGGVVDDLQERHHALALAVGALDVRTQRAHPRPVIAQAAGELGQQRVLLDGFVDAVQVVRHGGEVTTGQL